MGRGLEISHTGTETRPRPEFLGPSQSSGQVTHVLLTRSARPEPAMAMPQGRARRQNVDNERPRATR
jgi:hypothetical protein